MLAILKQRVIGPVGLRAELTWGVIGSFGLKSVNALLALAVSILLARALGPEGYGVYAFAFSLVALLAVPVQMGLPILVVREVARYQHAERWDLLRGLLQRANQAVLGLSLVICLVAGGVAWWLAGYVDETQLASFAWALLLLPLGALSRLRGAALQGLRRVVQGQLPEMLQPALLLIFAGIAVLAGGLTPPQAMALYCAAAALVFMVGTVMLLRALPKEVHTVQSHYDNPAWMHSVLPLSLLAGVQVINGQTDIVMLGLLATKEEVGLYRVALQGATLVAFTLTAVNVVLAPHIARLHSAGDSVQLQRMVLLSARVVLAAALPVAGAFIFFGESILGIAFGESYYKAHLALAILCVGQIVNAGMGSVGLILNMTGYEQETLKGVAVAAVANVMLNGVLIPLYGIEGAAVATALTLVLWNIILCRVVRLRLGLQSTAFRFPIRRLQS